MNSWLHFGIRNFSPAGIAFACGCCCLVVAMGAGAKIVCALPFVVGYDHFSAIRGVLELFDGFVRSCWGGRVSFDSDYSGEDDASTFFSHQLVGFYGSSRLEGGW
jgi:hypothetical protein